MAKVGEIYIGVKESEWIREGVLYKIAKVHDYDIIAESEDGWPCTYLDPEMEKKYLYVGDYIRSRNLILYKNYMKKVKQDEEVNAWLK